MIDPRITQSLRFNDDDTVMCAGDPWGNPCPDEAIAIHLWDGKPRCAADSPVANAFVPCTRCGEKPALRGESVEEDPVCRDCASELTNHEPEAVDPTQPAYAPFGSAGASVSQLNHEMRQPTTDESLDPVLCPDCGETLDEDDEGNQSCPNHCENV